MMIEGLKEAIERIGGQANLARAIGVSKAHVWNWLNREGHVPAQHVLTIEDATGVPCWRLRPDLYPPERFKNACKQS
ncbi:cytoplasmic chaperone TorD [Candidatus Parcubacteria bacterium]|nr:MAG: cytoplasmic chaperone TorD [Candidatus Parcubacteria bacterium]